MGLSASGKSTQAKEIAVAYGFEYISGSALLLARLGTAYDPAMHFWLEDKGRELNRQRDQSNIDLEIDEYLVSALQQKDHVITDSWTIPWLYRSADLLRIYLTPSLAARASRAVGSKQDARYDELTLAGLLDAKDESSRKRFLKIYGFDIRDSRGFDLVIDTSHLTREATQSLIRSYIDARNV